MNELDALLARAAAADSVMVAAPGGAPMVSPEAALAADRAARAQALAKEISDLLTMLVTVAAPALPRVAALYSPATCTAVGGAVAPVCVKRGWLANGIGGKWGEEITAGLVLLPLSNRVEPGAGAGCVELHRLELATAGAGAELEHAGDTKAAPAMDGLNT